MNQINRVVSGNPLRLMCLGDSITDGFWMPGGYRCALCRLISENGLEKKIDFVGQNWSGNIYSPMHSGFTGYSIDTIPAEKSVSGPRTGLSDIATRLLTEHPADLVFLLIGTNDILSLYDLKHFGQRLQHLTDQILQALPEHGFLCLATLPVMDASVPVYISPFFFTPESMDAAIADCNRQIRTLAQNLIAAGKPVVLAEISDLLTKDDLYDGVHPNEAGYEKIGSFFFRMLLRFLPQISTSA